MHFQISYKSLHTLLGAFEVNLNPVIPVEHPSTERVGTRQAIDKRSKAHALHYAPHPDRAGARGLCYSAFTARIAAQQSDLLHSVIFSQAGTSRCAPDHA